MPYIGQRPATGEANSFKILDEISSFTMTFDGSSASVVSVANDTITAREHRFITGQRVTYNDGGGTAITGLSDGVYYIIVEDRHTFKLATSANNATNGTAVNITGTGVGASHTINVAFDGVNTKFKATVDNGTRADITRSAQLMLSINGVVQEPHDNTTSPPTGYSTDHASTIIFSVAPAATDQFFGRLFASNVTNFDISDNVVDNFTGDGSTTSFSLSKSPANNRNLLVTIDGVVQYPDDNSAERAYDVAENVLSFTSAPGNGVEIQVRHIGFAGATSGGSGGVTGFYGRTGNTALRSTDNIVFNDATASGDIQAANVTVTGDLTIQGTTTTLDTVVTEVDRLEVGANNNTVAIAVTQSGSGYAAIFKGGNVGVKTSNPLSDFHVHSAASATALWLTNIVTTGATNSGFQLQQNANTTYFWNYEAGVLSFATSATERMRIASDGKVGIGTQNPDTTLTVKGTSDGVLNLDTTDTRGTLMRFKENGTTKQWVGSAEGMGGGLSGDQDDMGLRAVGNIFFSANGAERVRITETGNVGINSASPREKLDVNGTANIIVDNNEGIKLGYRGENKTAYIGLDANDAANAGSQSWANSAYIGFYSDGSSERSVRYRANAGSHIFQGTNGNEYVRIASDGKVGIGLTNPNRKLVISQANSTAYSGTDFDQDYHVLKLNNTTDSKTVGMQFLIGANGEAAVTATETSDGATDLIFGTRGSGSRAERLRIKSNGQIRIDQATGANNGIRMRPSGWNYDFRIGAVGTSGGSIWIGQNYDPNGNAVDFSSNGSNYLRFTTSGDIRLGTGAPNTLPEERLRIKGNGNVGIGTDDPLRQLEIFSTGHATAAIKGDTQSSLFFVDSGDSNIGQISYMHADNDMYFRVNDAERLRITSGGTVNIGGDYTSTNSRLRINSSSYPETTEYLAVFKAGVADGNRFKNRYIKIRNNFTGSVHGGVPIVWESNADNSNNKAYGAVVTEGNGDIRFLNAAATTEKAIGTDLLNTISGKLRITAAGRIEQENNNEDINMDSIASGQLKLDGNGYNAGFALNNQGLNIYHNSGYRGIIFGTNETERVRITQTGLVGIGTATPQQALDVNGNVNVVGIVTATSFSGDGSSLTGVGGGAASNMVDNGEFLVNQRGESSYTTGYTFDRWNAYYNQYSNTGGAITFTFSQSTDAPDGFENSLKIQCTALNGTPPSYQYGTFGQAIEGYHSRELCWTDSSNAKNATLSFYAKASNSGTWAVTISDYAGSHRYVATYTIASADTWERITINIPAPSSGTWKDDNNRNLIIYYDLGSGSMWQTGTPNQWINGSSIQSTSSAFNMANNLNSYIYLTGIQLEVGDSASDYVYEDYQDALIRAQRYYKRLFVYPDSSSSQVFMGELGSQSVTKYIDLDAGLMRANPSISLINNADIEVRKTDGTYSSGGNFNSGTAGTFPYLQAYVSRYHGDGTSGTNRRLRKQTSGHVIMQVSADIS